MSDRKVLKLDVIRYAAWGVIAGVIYYFVVFSIPFALFEYGYLELDATQPSGNYRPWFTAGLVLSLFIYTRVRAHYRKRRGLLLEYSAREIAWWVGCGATVIGAPYLVVLIAS